MEKKKEYAGEANQSKQNKLKPLDGKNTTHKIVNFLSNHAKGKYD
ncbi:MAG: hypothetical protein ACQEWF_22195 [Bacillota bacterium]